MTSTNNTIKKQLDLEKLEHVIKYVDMGQFVAFEDDDPVEDIDPNLESINENLKEFDKLFLEIGFWGYDDEYSDEPAFMINGNYIEVDITDEYYEKYYYQVAGYGIYLDKEYNVEYGYYTTEAPPSGHGMGYTTFHDFENAREDDIIKNMLIERLNSANIWK